MDSKIPARIAGGAAGLANGLFGGGDETYREDDAYAGGVQLPLLQLAEPGQDGQEHHSAAASEQPVGQSRRPAGDPSRNLGIHSAASPPKKYVGNGLGRSSGRGLFILI